MSSADFRAWLERHNFTYDAAAAQLGISRRLVAYYASKRDLPRYIVLACRYLDTESAVEFAHEKSGLRRVEGFAEGGRQRWSRQEFSDFWDRVSERVRRMPQEDEVLRSMLAGGSDQSKRERQG
ncbi:MAG: hypothetical protein JO134_14905 [Xanthobacteraceae bacterium]|nr:hypothetical protein [Xanthobacteraceae bacterium]